MSQKKKSGLQHGLSDILNNNPLLEEKAKQSSSLLAKVAESYPRPTDTSVQQSPESNRLETKDQQSPETIGHPGLLDTSDVQSRVLKDEGKAHDYQTPVTNSLETVGQQTPMTDSHHRLADTGVQQSIAHFKDQDLSTNSHQRPTVTRDQQTPVPESRVDQQTPVTNRPAYTNDHQTRVSSSRQSKDTDKGFTKVPHVVFDTLLRMLNPYEFKVYMRLFRLSYGFHKSQCLVGYTALSEACGLSTRHVQRVIPELEMKGLVSVVEVFNTAETRGTLYEIFTPDQETPVTSSHGRQTDTRDTLSPIKDHDHEDLKNTDHHQSAIEMMYTKLTGNSWTKSDQAAYRKISGLPVEQVIADMKAIGDRASMPIGSFSYFVTGILKTQAEGKGTIANKRRIKEIADQLRQVNVGRSYSIGEFAEDLKRRCVAEGISYTAEIINEIINSK